jgi:hypothetical protein
MGFRTVARPTHRRDHTAIRRLPLYHRQKGGSVVPVPRIPIANLGHFERACLRHSHGSRARPLSDAGLPSRLGAVLEAFDPDSRVAVRRPTPRTDADHIEEGPRRSRRTW